MFVAVALVVVAIIVIWMATRSPKGNFDVLWFYSPGCPHCRNMESAWTQFASSSSAETQKINIDDPANEAISNRFNVASVPYVIKLYTDGSVVEYNGNRTAADLLSWANQ